MPSAATKYDPLAGPLTPAQRSALFAAAGRHGLSLDDVRALTPTGSVSALKCGDGQQVP